MVDPLARVIYWATGMGDEGHKFPRYLRNVLPQVPEDPHFVDGVKSQDWVVPPPQEDPSYTSIPALTELAHGTHTNLPPPPC